jgi:hypothetical protein
VAKSGTAFKPVKIVQADQRRTFTVSGPSQTRIDGLTMDEVADLFRKLV